MVGFREVEPQTLWSWPIRPEKCVLSASVPPGLLAGLAGILACCLAQPALSDAQAVTGNMQGRVLALSGGPAAEVPVRVGGVRLRGTREPTTDRCGYFQITALPPGAHTVRLSRMGLSETVLRDAQVTLPGTTALGEIALESEPVELEELVVRAHRFTIDPVHTDVGGTLQARDYARLPAERPHSQRSPLVFPDLQPNRRAFQSRDREVRVLRGPEDGGHYRGHDVQPNPGGLCPGHQAGFGPSDVEPGAAAGQSVPCGSDR